MSNDLVWVDSDDTISWPPRTPYVCRWRTFGRLEYEYKVCFTGTLGCVIGSKNPAYSFLRLS
jgi:hypothetical protein